MDQEPYAIYRWACPNCGGAISSERLLKGLPCERCLKSGELSKTALLSGDDGKRSLRIEDVHKSVYDVLKKNNLACGYEEIVRVEKDLEEFSKIFRICVGRDSWSVQRTWAKRVLRGYSFSMIAPTGVGKTTFGIVTSIYLALNHGRNSLIVLPTIPLVDQVYARAEECLEKLRAHGYGRGLRILKIHSKASHNSRKERGGEGFSNTDAEGPAIVITTSAFFRRPENLEKLEKLGRIGFLFVDDVDAVLRGGKILGQLLKALKVGEEIIARAEELVSLKARLAVKEAASEEDLSRLRMSRNYIREKREKDLKDLVVVISSATGRARGRRIKILGEIFGFEVGTRYEVLRNVVDAYKLVGGQESILKETVELVKRLGNGGLIYVPKDLGVRYAEEVAAEISRRTSLRVEAFTSKKTGVLEAFARGEVNVLVGVSTYYGVAVRGIDLPEVIRYAIFLGVPRHKIPLDLEELDLYGILRILELSVDLAGDEEKEKILNTVARLRRLVARSSREYLQDVLSRARQGAAETGPERLTRDALDLVKSMLGSREFIERLEKHPHARIERAEDRVYVYIPDWATYVQASGRTSRLYIGGITRGLSIIIETDGRLVRGLERKLRMISEDFGLVRLEEADLGRVVEEIDRDREMVRKVKRGELGQAAGAVFEDLTKAVLVIVESPNKARTIARFFGRPSSKEVEGVKVYEIPLGNMTLLITSSGGHIYDLAVDGHNGESGGRSVHGVFVKGLKGQRLKRSAPSTASQNKTAEEEEEGLLFVPIYTTIKRCLRCGHQFTNDTTGGDSSACEDRGQGDVDCKRPRSCGLACPLCGSRDIRDSWDTVEALRRVALEVDEILIATDPDTEGEKIAFDLKALLYPYNMSIKRIEFHEVTRRAFASALSSPRDLRLELVKAQFVRRIEDRWIGFALSQKVTEYVCHKKRKEGVEGEECSRYRLSAGRVQTPVLGWVVRATEKHKMKNHLLVRLEKEGEKQHYLLEIPVKKLAREIKEGDELTITWKASCDKEQTINPPPPYTTDALLYDASQHLRIPAPRAMELAQDLFEAGLITYHRTDSTRVSDLGIEIARTYLAGKGLEGEIVPRRWGEGGAHEAIRPTRPMDRSMLEEAIAEGLLELRLSRDHLRLYELVFGRFIASQMRPAKARLCVIRFEASLHEGSQKIPVWRKSVREILDVEGKMADFYGYPYRSKPSWIKEGGSKTVKLSREMFRGGRLYTPGDLAAMMKKRGIGRPSTYAKIVDAVMKRYVIKEFYRRTGYLLANKRGQLVYSYLSRSKKYGSLVRVKRTRELEEKMDMVEMGEIDYLKVLRDLYDELTGYGLIGVGS